MGVYVNLLYNKAVTLLHGLYYIRIFICYVLGPSINGLVTDGNTKLCCRGFILALCQSATANKIDSEHARD